MIEYLVIHDSDSKYGNPFILDDWHNKRGFKYDHAVSGTPIHVGYHYLILNGRLYGSSTIDYLPEYDGLIIPCRPEGAIGAHCQANGRNSDSLGICFIGPFSETDSFTPKQFSSGAFLCSSLRRKYKIPVEKIVGHKEQDEQKSDPRFDMQALRFYLNQIGG